jgi:carboxymethylenebutenolidase
MAFEEYVQGEIVTDCAQGLLTRREALRRLTLLGVGAAAAGVMLAGCSDDEPDDAADSTSSTADGASTTASSTAATAGGSSAPVGPAPLDVEDIRFGPQNALTGSWSEADKPKGVVLIVHENRGLTPHFVALPGRLAASGYSALAVDLLSRKGGTDSFSDPAQATAALTGTPMPELVADLRAGLDELLRREPGPKAGVMGFCFGGGMVWQLLAAGEARLAAAVPFYGPLPDPHDFSKAKAAVLAIYGEKDQPRVNGGIEPARAALTAAKLPHEIVVEPGADHAFFNETGSRFNATAAADAHTRLLAWFGKYLS